MSLPGPPTASAVRRLGKRTLYGIARVTGVFGLLRWLNRRRLPILCYHSIVDMRLPPWVAAGGLHLHVTRFREHMEFLARRYRVVPLDEVVEAIAAADGPLPARSVAITFDDGYANTLSLAGPILEEFGFPATVFLPTDYIGRREMYWWDELAFLLSSALGGMLCAEEWGRLDLTTREGVTLAFARGHRLLASAPLEQRRRLLAALGAVMPAAARDQELVERLRPARWEECRAAVPSVRFGGHGAGHRLLDEIPLEDARADLERCGRTLRAELGRRASRVFCYPEGRWTPAIRSALEAAGFTGGVTAHARPSGDRLVDRADDAALLPRLGVSAHTTLPVFVGNAAGFRAWLSARAAV